MFLLDWPGGSWEVTLRWTLAIFGTYLAVFWLAVVFWTARDIHQRSSNAVTQAAAVLLVLGFFLPGLWLYLVMRPRRTRAQRYAQALEEEALRMELERERFCPSCARAVKEDFLLCPACTAELKKPCIACTKPLDHAWRICPYCGMDRGVAAEVAEVILDRKLPTFPSVPPVAVTAPVKQDSIAS